MPDFSGIWRPITKNGRLGVNYGFEKQAASITGFIVDQVAVPRLSSQQPGETKRFKKQPFPSNQYLYRIYIDPKLIE